jgi:hypothetical protein
MDGSGAASSSSDESIGIVLLGALISFTPALVGATIAKSSSGFAGLDDESRFADLAFPGLDRGEGATLLAVLFAGLVWLDWVAYVEWLVFGLAASLFGLVLLALGVLAFKALLADGVVVEAESLLVGAWTGLLTEYGPAVAGLVISCLDTSGFGRIFVGRIGATERPPWVEDVVSGRILTGAASEVDDVEVEETVRTGENADIAEPGRAGRFLLARAAFFWAAIVSLREGFGGPDMLLEKPRPGRPPLASAFLGEFGLSGAFSSNLCCVASRFAMIL